jgi:hypothetical protein
MLTELKTVEPASSWVNAERARLLEQIGGMNVARVSFFEWLRMAVRSLIPTSARSMLRGPIAAALSGLGLIVGGSMASVSASEQSVPGDLLFPIKIVSEQTRLALTTDKKEKFRLKGEFVNRRVEEIKKIASTNVEKKPERLKEATEILRRDLDTVKNQLTDVSGGKPAERVEVAKIVDKTSSEVVAGLKIAKASLPSEIRPQVAEVEAVAVNTSVKAVNAILDAQTDEESKKLVTKEELIQSISQKVEGVSEHLTSATQQLAEAGLLSATATTALASSATSSLALSASAQKDAGLATMSASTSSIADLISAHASLAEARELLSQDRLSEVGDKLLEASKSVSSAERTADSLAQSSTQTASTTTSLVSGANTPTSTPSISPATSSTPLPTTATGTPPTSSSTPSTQKK